MQNGLLTSIKKDTAMIIKSISKIFTIAQLSGEYTMKEKKIYISAENLETYLEEYLAGNLPKYFAAYQEQLDGLREMVAELKGALDGEKTASPRNIMRGGSYAGEDNVFGSTIRRKEVVSISFCNKFPESLSGFEKSWDVSEYGDGSVIAYAKRCGEYYEIHICGAGVVIAPASCKSLKELDVSGFDTSRVTTMDDMFRGCKKLQI